MTRMLLIRHAESTWNAKGRWQGRADPELSERGREQANRAAPSLNGKVKGIVASDLRRARETAEIIGGHIGIDDVTIEPGLREIDVGDWTGLTRDEIDARWPGSVDAWRAGELEAAPGGERRAMFRRRLLDGLRRVADDPWDGELLVVSHAGAIGTLEHHLGVHPGVALPRLCGRWFEMTDELRAVGDRISLLGE